MKGPLSSSVDDLARHVGPAQCGWLAACLMRPSREGLERPSIRAGHAWARHPILYSPRGESGTPRGRAPLLTRGRFSGPATHRAPPTSFALRSGPLPSLETVSIDLRRLQPGAIRDHAMLQEPPQLNEQLPGQRDN